jgi:trehalose 6-phosphate synthase/phosphatase
MFYNSVVNNDQLADNYRQAKSRLLLLDYDGVLAPIRPLPEQAAPSREILKLLEKLTADPRNTCVVISGRPRETLDDWLGHLPLAFAAEHGLWHRSVRGEWEILSFFDLDWKPSVEAVMHQYESLLSGSFVEEKHAALAFHYRNTSSPQKTEIVGRLVSDIEQVAASSSLQVLNGKKVVEVLPAGVDKGKAARFWLEARTWDFILAAGDDVTDEALFQAAPASAYSIKVGDRPTFARSTVNSQPKFMHLLKTLADL